MGEVIVLIHAAALLVERQRRSSGRMDIADNRMLARDAWQPVEVNPMRILRNPGSRQHPR
jgi:hypothetical protein